MGQKAATVKAALPQPRVYKSSPLLVKGGKRSRQEALPSALHMGICVGLCLLIFAIVNVSSSCSWLAVPVLGSEINVTNRQACLQQLSGLCKLVCVGSCIRASAGLNTPFDAALTG